MSDFENLDHYELLGISRSASPDEIRRAYRREISKYHPDRFVNGTPQQQEYASQRSQRLTEAYSVLSDFAARSAYNRGQAPTRLGKRPPQPAGPVQPRDHQAELYEQAQGHLAAGRLLQAIGALRQLQQINPFYRDSGELLSAAEARLNSRQAQSARRLGRPLLVAGGVGGGVALAILAAWAIGMRGATASRNPGATSAPVALIATFQPTRPPEPTFAPERPTEVTTVVIEPSAAPIETPTDFPTITPTTMPTDFPTVTPTAAPSAVPAGEPGALLFSDDFASAGWADLRGSGWSVGYQDGRYHINANQGIGTIWSYRAAPSREVSIGVDVQVASGEGGLLLRFFDVNNYVSVSLNPSRTSFRVEQHSGGEIIAVGGGQSEAIQTGGEATNRLVTRLRGDHVQVLCNGQLLAEVDTPGAPNSARYGLLVITNESASEAFFDNLEIRR